MDVGRTTPRAFVSRNVPTALPERFTFTVKKKKK
jgi:hypothetical protein